MNLNSLAFANLRSNLSRSIGLAVLVAALAFVALGGVLVTSSLNNGISSLEARLGADILVAPDSAKSTADLESIVLEGTPGYFYMDKSFIDKVAQREGVEKVSPQYFLATVKAGCCTMPVQIIGFDPETDFSIQPWIARSHSNELGYKDVVTGSNVTGAAGSTIMFYGVECRIVGRLDETGTALDNAVFTSAETLRELIRGSQEQGISVLADNDPEQVISTIQVKVQNGYSVTDVVNDINLHVRGVAAVQTKAMTSDVADSVAGIQGIIVMFMSILAIVLIVVLVATFTITGKQRSREFSVLRVVGASRSMIKRLALTESFIVSGIGALVGIALAIAALFAFNGAIEDALGLPFLMPDTANIAICSVIVLVIAFIIGPVTSATLASRLARQDVGQALREE